MPRLTQISLSIIFLFSLFFLSRNNLLAANCTDDSQCASNQRCDLSSGTCKLLPPNFTRKTCNSDFDCDNDYKCDFDNTCVLRVYEKCSSDSDCAKGQKCDTRDNICKILTDSNENPTRACGSGDKVDTPFGCISYNLTEGGLLKSILPIAVGLGGALSLGLMLYGFFILSTSAGIPDKVKAGQEIITSAVGGLLFIIFSVILMNLIGVKILAIPGL